MLLDNDVVTNGEPKSAPFSAERAGQQRGVERNTTCERRGR